MDLPELLVTLSSAVTPLEKANTLIEWPIERDDLALTIGASIMGSEHYGTDAATSAVCSLLNSRRNGVARSRGYSLIEAMKFVAVLDLVRAEIRTHKLSKTSRKTCERKRRSVSP